MATATPCRVLESNRACITQEFKKGVHHGIDLVSVNILGKRTTCWLVAHTEGEVVAVEKGNPTYGNYVKIKHPNGWESMFAHIKTDTIKVKKGEYVYEGQRIGYMGSTGKSTGAHLHWALRDETTALIDPKPFMNADLSHDTPWVPVVGETCLFTGSTHYSNAGAAKGSACKPGKVIVKRIYKLGEAKHPFSVKRVTSGAANGWVDQKDLSKL